MPLGHRRIEAGTKPAQRRSVTTGATYTEVTASPPPPKTGLPSLTSSPPQAPPYPGYEILTPPDVPSPGSLPSSALPSPN